MAKVMNSNPVVSQNFYRVLTTAGIFVKRIKGQVFPTQDIDYIEPIIYSEKDLDLTNDMKNYYKNRNNNIVTGEEDNVIK